jgi:hypothetical protein
MTATSDAEAGRPSPPAVVLHVGTHKTGTTSIQTFLRDENDGLLAAAGYAYPSGFLLPVVHLELSLLTIRPERVWPARLRFPETERASWRAAARAHVRAQIENAEPAGLVYVNEDLSYLRFDDEFERLGALLEGRSVQVVICLRDRAAFMRSYRAQIEGTGFEPSDDPGSFAYVRPDSWLVDYDALVEGYERRFGAANVHVLDYEAIMAGDGTVIPAFAEVVGIPRSSLPRLDKYRFNATGQHIRLPQQQLDAIRRQLALDYP